ncbi:AraC family transcriptional regulator [Variovorax sp. TBS-050B]|uniref:AraC family transcriptional regulator n=1 Tax=Variovorax sp. TBS-050B TaxID=2940551 RepID=UPI0024764F52|nr:AraC family transcriptional regulator [Variovorax sp. TBS-050B]MDH6590505.1 AraC family transcriptional regulator [Variovorax sp. TBS-050B]
MPHRSAEPVLVERAEPSATAPALSDLDRLRFDRPPAGPRGGAARLRGHPPFLLDEPRILAALHRMEADLMQPPSLDELAAGCGLGRSHFHRLFSETMGETVVALRRRRQLETAAIHLLAGAQSVLDIAVGAGYGSIAAFSRAFQRHFGQPPTLYRSAARRATPPVEPRHHALARRARVQVWPAPALIGLRFHGGYARVEAFWQRFADEVARIGLDAEALELVAITRDSPEITPEALIRYDCCFVDPGLPEPLPAPFRRCTVPGGRYVALEHRAPYQAIFPAYRALAHVWPLAHGEPLAEAPAVERYHAPPWRHVGRPQNLSIMVKLL